MASVLGSLWPDVFFHGEDRWLPPLKPNSIQGFCSKCVVFFVISSKNTLITRVSQLRLLNQYKPVFHSAYNLSVILKFIGIPPQPSACVCLCVCLCVTCDSKQHLWPVHNFNSSLNYWLTYFPAVLFKVKTSQVGQGFKNNNIQSGSRKIETPVQPDCGGVVLYCIIT